MEQIRQALQQRLEKALFPVAALMDRIGASADQDPGADPNELRALIGSKVRESLIASNGTDVLRSAATEEGAQPDAEPGVGPGSRCHAALTKGG